MRSFGHLRAVFKPKSSSKASDSTKASEIEAKDPSKGGLCGSLKAA
jgi:hypothetical protein